MFNPLLVLPSRMKADRAVQIAERTGERDSQASVLSSCRSGEVSSQVSLDLRDVVGTQMAEDEVHLYHLNAALVSSKQRSLKCLNDRYPRSPLCSLLRDLV